MREFKCINVIALNEIKREGKITEKARKKVKAPKTDGKGVSSEL